MIKYVRGQIWYYKDPQIKVTYHSSIQGSVQSGSRPVIIVSNDVGNKYSKICMVVPLTSKEKTPLPTHFKFRIGDIDNTAMCEQISTVPQSALIDYVGMLEPCEIKLLNDCIDIALGLQTTQESNSTLTKSDVDDTTDMQDKPVVKTQDTKRHAYIIRSVEDKQDIIRAYDLYKNRGVGSVEFILNRYGFSDERVLRQSVKRWKELGIADKKVSEGDK